MSPTPLTLSLSPAAAAVCRLAPDASLPPWLPRDGFVSITRTADELSIVCDASAVPDGVQVESGFRTLKIEGPLDFALTGILLAVAAPLAAAGVSIFAISTYDTDYVLVPEADLNRAEKALAAAGHTVRR